MSDKRMYPNDGGLKKPVREYDPSGMWDVARKAFGLPPKQEPFLPGIIK